MITHYCKLIAVHGWHPQAQAPAQPSPVTQLVCFEKFIEDFIPECDAAHQDLKAPITQEYERLNDGSSELIWLTRKLMSRVNVFLVMYEESL